MGLLRWVFLKKFGTFEALWLSGSLCSEDGEGTLEGLHIYVWVFFFFFFFGFLLRLRKLDGGLLSLLLWIEMYNEER